MKPSSRFVFIFLTCTLALLGCRSIYYSTMEVFGKEKRDLLKSNVEAARNDQKEASDQFKDALTRLKEMYGFEGGELEKVYTSLNRDYERCVARSDKVKSRVKSVETISSDLFKEWESEIETMSNTKLRVDSRTKLEATRDRYETLHSAMKKAEQSMDPVLTQLHDQVLYLKHNLNAQAIGSLQAETKDIEKEIAKLISDMNASIAEADKFIEALP